eukprot:6490455-Amphidinium_carterae.2
MKRSWEEEEPFPERDSGGASSSTFAGKKWKRSAWDVEGEDEKESVPIAVEGGANSEDDVEPESTKAEGARALKDLLIGAYKSNQPLSAKLICNICHFATVAGAKGLQDLARPPSTSSSNHAYVTRVDKAMLEHTLEVPLFQMLAPQRVKVKGKGSGSSRQRVDRPLHFLPPHMVVGTYTPTELASLRSAFYDAVREQTLPQSYWQHPIVRANGTTPTIPFSLYMDGVRHLKKDSILGITLCPSLGGAERRLVFAVRKSRLCQCGCRGYCTMFVAFQTLVWSVESMCRGKHPELNPDGEPLPAAYAARQGQDLPFRACILQIKADWVEFTSTLGLAAHNSKIGPCFLCHSGLKNMHEVDTLLRYGPECSPWKDKTHTDLLTACSNCEVVVEAMSVEECEAIATNLVGQKGRSNAGMRLQCNIPSLSLCKGDRFEPSIANKDWQSFKTAGHVASATFWRSSAEQGVRHRNILLDEALGMSLQQMACLDLMHIFALGIHQVFLMEWFWFLFNKNVLKIERNGAEEVRALTLERLEAELFAWYDTQDRGNTSLTRVSGLDMKAFGTRNAPSFNFKAAETLGILRWSAEYTKTLPASVSGIEEWCSAATGLVNMWSRMREHGLILPESAQRVQIEIVKIHKKTKTLHLNRKAKEYSVIAPSCLFETVGKL